MVIAIGLVAGCTTSTASPPVAVVSTVAATATPTVSATASSAWPPTIPLGHACDLRGPSSMNQAVFWPQVGGSIRA